MYIYFVVKEGSVQFIGDTSTTTSDVKVGSVLAYYNDQWGIILHYNGWNEMHVQVVCRQLGYHSITGDFSPCSSCGHVPCSNRFPIGLWETGAKCTGNEESLSGCISNYWRLNRSCDMFYSSVGVRCSGRFQTIDKHYTITYRSLWFRYKNNRNAT